MATESIAGADWARLSSDQRADARIARGFQGGNGIPFTDARTAVAVHRFWNNAIAPVVIAASDEGKAIPASALLAAAGLRSVGGIVLPTDSPSALSITLGMIDASEIGVRDAGRKMNAALVAMAGAMTGVFATKNGAGVDCMSLSNATRFWDGVSTLAIQFGFLAAQISISVGSFLEAALQGAKEGAENTAHFIGEQAGKAAAFAGELAGDIGRGAAKGFGLGNTAVVVGGGLLIAKFVW